MKKELVELNFCELLGYGGQPEIHYRYPSPVSCDSYCVACEESGVLESSGGELTLMSHGCSGSDYEKILGPMPTDVAFVDVPVMFLLEDPGADGRYKNGEVIHFRGAIKKPPVNHYYWSPPPGKWPRYISDFINGPHFYGPYFAYLMQKHGIRNTYITNLVKCKWSKSLSCTKSNSNAVAKYCAQRYLSKECAIFDPKIVVCFGKKVLQGYEKFISANRRGTITVELLHPAYIKNKSQMDPQRRSKQQLLEENDRRLSEALSRAG